MIALGSNATGRGRPKLTLDAVVHKNLSMVGLCEQVALNRTQWRKIIHIANPN
ncbi:hypothetical protein RHMOL_Rhmol02G0200800 [Rhododendron molle]|nr:hypothetical protein RHMOL_Rhmol02G0200800 [Rhododendron molle]